MFFRHVVLVVGVRAGLAPNDKEAAVGALARTDFRI